MSASNPYPAPRVPVATVLPLLLTGVELAVATFVIVEVVVEEEDGGLGGGGGGAVLGLDDVVVARGATTLFSDFNDMDWVA
jgi:hypothetical protein